MLYFEIDLREWTYLFNLLFDEELKEQRIKVYTGDVIVPTVSQQPKYKEYSFWQFGDELVKMGIGYWAFYMSGKENVYIKFVIPNFIYEAIRRQREYTDY